jgi:UMF1 family MFS transporter
MLISLGRLSASVGYFVQTGMDFCLLAGAVGLVMGGIQSLSEEYLRQVAPLKTPLTPAFLFQFLQMSVDKVSTVAGTFTLGIVERLYGPCRNGVMALAVFFVISLALLTVVRIHKIATA